MILEVTKEMEHRVAAFDLAMKQLVEAKTEAAAAAWKDAADRHRAELGRMVYLALVRRVRITVAVEEILDGGVHLAVALPGTEAPCAE